MVVQAKATVSVVADTKKFGKKVEGEVKGVNRAFGGMSTAIKGIGVLVSAVLASQFVRALSRCIEKAIELERNVRAVKQSLEHTGQAGMINLERLRDEFKKTAKAYTVKGGGAEVAENYRLMVTGAYNAAEAQAELGNVSKANMLWQGRYGDALEYCNQMITAFDLGTEKTTELLEKGAVACDRGRMSFDELAKAAGKYTPAIKGGVITTDEFIALVSTMTAKGASGRAALTGIGDALLDLPDTMDDVGMSFNGFIDALGQLRDKKMTAEEWKEFAPEVEERTSLEFIVSLYNDIIEAQEAMTEKQGALNRETIEYMGSAEYAYEQVGVEVNELKETIGQKLKGAILEVADVWGETLGGIETRYHRIKRVAEETMEAMKPTGARMMPISAYGDAPSDIKRMIADLKAVGYGEEDIAFMAPKAIPYLEAPEKKKKKKGKPTAAKAEERFKPLPSLMDVELLGLREIPEEETGIEAARKRAAALTKFRQDTIDKEARLKGQLEADALEAEGQMAIENMASLFGSAGAEALWGDGEEVAKRLGMALANTVAANLATKGLKALLMQIPGLGPIASLLLREGGVIKAAGGVSILPARPGGWTFPFAGRWITGAEGGQDEMLAVLPPGRQGRELLMRDVMPAYFPGITQTTSFRPTVNTEISLKGLDPYHVTAAVHADQGEANRARIQRTAS